jgi:hypothetical protein
MGLPWNEFPILPRLTISGKSWAILSKRMFSSVRNRVGYLPSPLKFGLVSSFSRSASSKSLCSESNYLTGIKFVSSFTDATAAKKYIKLFIIILQKYNLDIYQPSILI